MSTEKIRLTRGELSDDTGFFNDLDAGRWRTETSRWAELHSEIREAAARLAAVSEAPLHGEVWDQIVTDYATIREHLPELIHEAIGIDVHRTGLPSGELAKRSGLSRPWLSKHGSAWEKEHR